MIFMLYKCDVITWARWFAFCVLFHFYSVSMQSCLRFSFAIKCLNFGLDFQLGVPLYGFLVWRWNGKLYPWQILLHVLLIQLKLTHFQPFFPANWLHTHPNLPQGYKSSTPAPTLCWYFNIFFHLMNWVLFFSLKFL